MSGICANISTWTEYQQFEEILFTFIVFFHSFCFCPVCMEGIAWPHTITGRTVCGLDKSLGRALISNLLLNFTSTRKLFYLFSMVTRGKHLFEFSSIRQTFTSSFNYHPVFCNSTISAMYYMENFLETKESWSSYVYLARELHRILYVLTNYLATCIQHWNIVPFLITRVYVFFVQLLWN